jgi:hypothetical protein
VKRSRVGGAFELQVSDHVTNQISTTSRLSLAADLLLPLFVRPKHKQIIPTHEVVEAMSGCLHSDNEDDQTNKAAVHPTGVGLGSVFLHRIKTFEFLPIVLVL